MTIRSQMSMAALALLASSSLAQSWSGGGTWSQPVDRGLMAIHLALMPGETAQDCELLAFNRSRTTGELEDLTFLTTFKVRRFAAGSGFTYSSGTDVAFNTGTDPITDYQELFCAGHALTHDGRLFVAGGHGHPGEHGNDHGITDVYLYDPISHAFSQVSPMWDGRWYPTVLALPDRQMLVMEGTREPNDDNKYPSLWIEQIPDTGNPDYQAKLPIGDLEINYYPMVFIDPQDGKPLYSSARFSGGNGNCKKYNPLKNEWTSALSYGSVTNVEFTYPSAVNVDGFILKCGGATKLDEVENEGPTSVTTTLSIDLLGSRTWTARDDLAHPRKNHTLVALPDGKVLAIGGNLGGYDENYDKGRYDGGADIEPRTHPEMFDTLDPGAGWTTLAGQPEGEQIPRGYHSTALLTPNAEVVVAGGENTGNPDQDSNSIQRRMQIFTPPYGGDTSWKTSGNRPTIGSSTPSEFAIGEALEVAYTVASGREPERLTLISLGATTHSFNQHQHVTFLPFEAGEDSLSVDWQAHHYHLPPGYYMLFLVDDDGIPSVAKIVRLADFDRCTPGSGALSSGTFYSIEAYPTQLSLGDNVRLGGGFQPFGSNCFQLLTLSAANVDYLRFNVYLEHKSSRKLDFSLKAYNYDTSSYVEIGSGTTPDNALEMGEEYAVQPVTLPDRQPFVRESDGEIKLKIDYADNYQHQGGYLVSIDRVEARVR